MKLYCVLKKYGTIVVYAFKRFYDEKRLLWAASLTYTTIFSLIPLLSVLFFVFNVFGDLSQLKSLIQPYVYKMLAPGAQEAVLTMINGLVENINFGTIGIFSTTVLIISVFLLLFEIEYALNEIWLIRHRLPVVSRAAIYWAALTIGPMILAVSLFIIVTLQSYKLVQSIETFINPDIFSSLSYALIWIAFTGIYYFMPGTRVKLWSALFGGIIAGSFWKIAGFGFSLYTSGFFFYYPKVYGSLAAIPMFLLWIFLCWALFLLGAEMAYLHQNYSFYKSSHKHPELTGKAKEYLTLRILFFIGKKFLGGEQPPSLSALAYSLNIPFHFLRELVDPLVRHGILVESSLRGACFVPGRPLSSIKLFEVLETIRQEKNLVDAFYEGDEDAFCRKVFFALHSDEKTAYMEKSIKELLAEADSSEAAPAITVLP